MYNLNYKTLLVVDPDLFSSVLRAGSLSFLSSCCPECIRLRRGFDVKSSFVSTCDLRAILSFIFPSLFTPSRLVVNRNISFAWLIVYLNKNYNDIGRGVKVKKHCHFEIPTFYKTMLNMLPHWTLETWASRFSARITIAYLRLSGSPTSPACHSRFAADGFFERFPIPHTHQIV